MRVGAAGWPWVGLAARVGVEAEGTEAEVGRCMSRFYHKNGNIVNIMVCKRPPGRPRGGLAGGKLLGVFDGGSLVFSGISAKRSGICASVIGYFNLVSYPVLLDFLLKPIRNFVLDVALGFVAESDELTNA